MIELIFCCNILLHFLSKLLSKACFTLNNLFYFLRALSNQTIPCQALTKIDKRTTTKTKKWKWFRWSPKSQSLSSCQPSPLDHFPFHSTISYQYLLHWTKHPCSQLNAGCKIEYVQTPILASWKKSLLIKIGQEESLPQSQLWKWWLQQSWVVLEIVHAYHFNMSHSDMKLIGWLMIAYNYDDLNHLETAFG